MCGFKRFIEDRSVSDYTQVGFAQSREEKVKRLLNEGNVPIEFWGVVVDQDEQPIPDAVISYRIHRAGRLEPSGFVGDDSRRGQVASARDGGFSIMGDRGVTLSIEGIQKSGYRQPARQRMDFAFQGSPELFRPSPRQPQTFVLIHSESMPSLVRYSRKLALPWDGQAMRFDLLNGQASPSGELIIVASRGQPDPRGRFDWSLTITVDGGGVVEANEQGAHIAPAGEYEPAWTCGFGAASKPWRFGLTKQLYFKTSKAVFGRLRLRMDAGAKPTGAGLQIEGFLNPTGARLLEYDASGVTQ